MAAAGFDHMFLGIFMIDRPGLSLAAEITHHHGLVGVAIEAAEQQAAAGQQGEMPAGGAMLVQGPGIGRENTDGWAGSGAGPGFLSKP
jgi:hypothetical protein